MSNTDRTDPPTPDSPDVTMIRTAMGRAFLSDLLDGGIARLTWSGPSAMVLAIMAIEDQAAALAALPSAPDQRLREALRVARDRLVSEVREGTRTLSDAYRNDADEAKRWATAVDRIHLAVAQFAIDEDAALSEATTSPEATLDVAWREAEAALPEGSWLYLAKTSKGRYGAQVRGGKPTGASGSTPTAALQALAARLRGPA